MHTEITVKTRTTPNRVLTERLVLDDDEFDARLLCNRLSHCLNNGTREEHQDALHKIQAFNLKTVFRTVNGVDFFEVRL